MTTCKHPQQAPCEFCDPLGRMNVAVDGNGDPQALRPQADNLSRRGMLRGAVATSVGAVDALASAGWAGNSSARGEGGKLGLSQHDCVPANDQTVHWGYFSKNLKPQVDIESGDFVTLETLTHHAGDDFDRLIKGDPGAKSVFFRDKTRQGVNRRGAERMPGATSPPGSKRTSMSAGIWAKTRRALLNAPFMPLGAAAILPSAIQNRCSGAGTNAFAFWNTNSPALLRRPPMWSPWWWVISTVSMSPGWKPAARRCSSSLPVVATPAPRKWWRVNMQRSPEAGEWRAPRMIARDPAHRPGIQKSLRNSEAMAPQPAVKGANFSAQVRWMKLLSRRGVLVAEEGSTHVADNDGDADEARSALAQVAAG